MRVSEERGESMIFKNERKLQEDLAEHLRSCGYLTYTEIEIKDGHGRADVIAVKPAYTNKDIRIYEVKNNRSAFDNDNKYTKYMESCHRFYIACPKGLIQKDELPPKVGLIYRNDNGWYVVKAPRKNHPEITLDFAFSLLYHGHEETLKLRRIKDRIIFRENATLREQAYNIGKEIGRRLDKNRETQVEEWVRECSEIFKKYLDVEICNDRKQKGLPDLYDIEYILESLGSLAKDIQYIKDIGEYLRNLDLPEENEKRTWRSRKEKRNRAMKFKKNA